MGLDAALDRFWDAAHARQLGIDSIQVVADDGPRGERRRTDDIRRDVYSVSKTGHLLRMTAGNGYRWADDDADHPGDPARDFLATPLVAEPGSTYAYRGGNTYVLSRIVHSISGRDLRDFLLPRLFAPLGIRNPQWLRCPLGFSLGAIGLQLRTSEITRIAQLLLNEGTHNGHRLVPPAYIARMTADTTDTGRPEPDNRTYGLHVWRCARDGAWRMDGIYGQFGIILPAYHATVSVTAHYQGPTTQILDCAWEHIVPALT